MPSPVAILCLLAAVSVVWTAPPNPCYRAQMPNNDDPYSFYKCDAGGRAHLWRCAAGTMYDRRTQICDWEDQVRARNGQTGSSRPINNNRDKIVLYVKNVDWESVVKTAAYAYGKVKPILDSVYEDYRGKYPYGKDGNVYSSGNNYKNKGKYYDKQKYGEYSEEEVHNYYPSNSKVPDRETGQRPSRQPKPTDPDYDNGEDWEEYQKWRDQFVSSDSGRQPSRDRDWGRDTDSGRNPGNGRVDCSGRSESPGGAPRMYQNPDDCSTYFTCNMRRPVLTHCPRGLNYNPRRQGCDASEPPGCLIVRGSQTPNNVFIYARSLPGANVTQSPPQEESTEELDLSSTF